MKLVFSWGTDDRRHGDWHWLLHVLCVIVAIPIITVDDGDDNS